MLKKLGFQGLFYFKKSESEKTDVFFSLLLDYRLLIWLRDTCPVAVDG